MYKNHFGLERRIFHGNVASPDVFVGPQVASIMSGIKKALAGTDAVVSITGPVGCGKSTAVSHAVSAISGKNAIVRVGRFPLQRGELLDLMFDHMRIQQRPPRGNQKLALFRQLLFNLAANDSRMFILVEDASFLGPQLLAELEVVTAADTGPSDGANVILMGDESLNALVKDNSLARLRQRMRFRRGLEPCSVGELGGYLRHCFRQAGGDFDKTFDGGAAEFLHELSGGILRVVNNLVESSMEAAAEAGASSVELNLVKRIADEEFGLTGTFTTPPRIASAKPDPQHSDDATAELVALSLPETKSRAAASQPAPEPAASAISAGPDDEIPDLIQDTQPALSVLPEKPADDPATELKRDTLPDLESLSPELAQQAQALDELDAPGLATQQPAQADATESAIPTLTDTNMIDGPVKAAPAKPRQPAPTPAAPEPREPAPEPLSLEPESPALETKVSAPEAEAAALDVDASAPESPAPEQEYEATQRIPALDNVPELTIADDSEPITPAAQVEEDDTPDWDKDPTLAELRPDLEALERAMAVAHGADPKTGVPEVPEPPPPVVEEKKEETLSGVPEITLDDSINRKVDAAEIERRQRQEEETGVIEEDAPDHAQQDAAKAENQRKADAELQKIAAGLAEAKTLEDVDDKMAETLFGEELSIAAAEVAKMVASGQSPDDVPEPESAPAAPSPNAPANAAQPDLEKEFEDVWGEKPDAEVSIESQFETQHGGLDMSASQRLATVRALNTDQKSPAASARPTAQKTAVKPESIEEQITTSMTQTLKTLNVHHDPAAINDDDDDDTGKRKGGFFSRFRR
jgi:type II secretory pathway predicted ATPase ExeA